MNSSSNKMQKQFASGFVNCVQRQIGDNVRQPYMTFLVLFFLKEAWREKIEEEAEKLLYTGGRIVCLH